MDITVTFRHMEATESLKAYAEEKLSKIKKYFDSPLEAHVVLTVEKFRHQADVTLNADGTRIKAVEETGDMYSAIDQVLDKIEKQVKRHKSKTKEYRGENAKEEEPSADEGPGDPGGAADEEMTIEVEALAAKPMDPEEAAMQLSMSRQDFLVFRNANSDEVNVLYKKGNGNLGLIQPGT